MAIVTLSRPWWMIEFQLDLPLPLPNYLRLIVKSKSTTLTRSCQEAISIFCLTAPSVARVLDLHDRSSVKVLVLVGEWKVKGDTTKSIWSAATDQPNTLAHLCCNPPRTASMKSTRPLGIQLEVFDSTESPPQDLGKSRGRRFSKTTMPRTIQGWPVIVY